VSTYIPFGHYEEVANTRPAHSDGVTGDILCTTSAGPPASGTVGLGAGFSAGLDNWAWCGELPKRQRCSRRSDTDETAHYRTA